MERDAVPARASMPKMVVTDFPVLWSSPVCALSQQPGDAVPVEYFLIGNQFEIVYEGLSDQHAIEGIPDGTSQMSGTIGVGDGDWQFLEVLVGDAGTKVCMLPSTSPPARCSAVSPGAIAQRSPGSSLRKSTVRRRPNWRCT